MFRAVFSPIIKSTLLYLQYLVMFTQVAAGWLNEFKLDYVDCAGNAGSNPAGCVDICLLWLCVVC
jgi:hypothetical protein